MSRRYVRKKKSKRGVGYPSLKEHLISRRRFIELAGGCLATSALWAACGRGLGAAGPDGSATDAGADAGADADIDGDVQIGGVTREPDYYTARLPATRELTAYLVPEGRCVFYVNVATYSAITHDALVAHRTEANDVCRSTVSDFTYETLDSPEGVGQAEDDLLDSLLVWLRDVMNGEEPTLEAVTLHLVELTPEPGLDGDPPRPSYP